MTYIKQPEKEGESMPCPNNCGEILIARLKQYKDYPDKIQWQDPKETKAHFDKDGNCKGNETADAYTSITATGTTIPQEHTTTTSSNIPEGNIDPIISDDMVNEIYKNLLLLDKIDKMTIDYLGKDSQVQKIGLWTKLIFQAVNKK